MTFTADVFDHAAQWLASRTWLDVAEMYFVLMSVIGQHFISHRQRKGFYFWLAGNVVAVVIWTMSQRYPTALLYCYFTYKCLTGVRNWGELDARSDGARRVPIAAGSASGA